MQTVIMSSEFLFNEEEKLFGQLFDLEKIDNNTYRVQLLNNNTHEEICDPFLVIIA